MADPKPPQSDWKPPLLGNKQPRPMAKGGEKEWFDNPIRAPGRKPESPSEEPPEAKSEPHKSAKGKGK